MRRLMVFGAAFLLSIEARKACTSWMEILSKVGEWSEGVQHFV